MSIHIEEPHKRILNVPDLLKLYLIIPIGYPDVSSRGDGVRRPLQDMVHRERYDMSKYMSNEDVIKYLYSLREATVPVHSASRAVVADEEKVDGATIFKNPPESPFFKGGNFSERFLFPS